MGIVDVSYDEALHGAFFKNAYWTWTDYEQSWRNGFCIWQAPLKLLTLGIWTIFVPTAWPCVARIPSDAESRMERAIEKIKNAAAALGGNVAVIVSRDATYSATTRIQAVGQAYIARTDASKDDDMELRAIVLRESPTNESPTARVVNQPQQSAR